MQTEDQKKQGRPGNEAIWLLQLYDYPYYVNFMITVMEKSYAVGADTRVSSHRMSRIKLFELALEG